MIHIVTYNIPIYAEQYKSSLNKLIYITAKIKYIITVFLFPALLANFCFIIPLEEVLTAKTIYITTDELAEKIDKSINEDKVYLDSKFSLADWALMLGTNRTYLSEYINKVFKMSFYDYVNKLRIGEAKKIFEKGAFRSIDEVAQSCGYASISTFNRNFSKLVGMTPSNYIKTLHK